MLFLLENNTLFLLILCVTLTVGGQLSCHNFSGQPVLGSNLPYCQLQNTLQCCTHDHLMTMKENITIDLIDGMQLDLQSSVILPWMNAYTNATATIDEFLTIFLDIFPFPHNLTSRGSQFLNNFVRTTLTQQLHPNYTVNPNFDFEGYITNFTTALIDIFTMSIPYPNTQKQCLNGLLRNHINTTAIQSTGAGLGHLQNIFQTLDKTRKLLVNLTTTTLSSYTFSEQCLTAIINQYCSHCVRHIPLLCDSICIPVVAGCNSPVHDNLLPQFDALWNVSRQLLGQIQSLMNCTLQIDTLLILPPSSIHSLAMQSQIMCQVDFLELLHTSSKRKKRFVNNIGIPYHLEPAVNLMSSVQGVFNYGTPAFCTSRSTSNNCWNGTGVMSNGSLLYEVPVTIQDQAINPVYNFNTYDLYQQAIGLGTPVAFFLQDNDFLSTLPKGILIPNITHLTPPPSPSSTPVLTPTSSSISTVYIIPDSSSSNSISISKSSHSPTTRTLIQPTIILIYPSGTVSLYAINCMTVIIFTCLSCLYSISLLL